MDEIPSSDPEQKPNLIHRLLKSCTRPFSKSTARDKQQSIAQTRQQAPADQSRGLEHTMQSKNDPNLQDSHLDSAINDGSFWTLPDLDVLELIKAEFPQELERLKNATFVRNPNVPRPEVPSIAESLYGQDYPEINRTLVGVLALRWLHNNNYDTFVGTQGPPASIRLRRESFDWLRNLFDQGLINTQDTYTLILSMVTNDLGKDPNLARDYADKNGIDISHVNHDMILYHAVEAGMVPALDRLTKQDKEYLLLGIKLGSDFNFGQLAQAENAPASLTSLLEMRGHERAFQMRFMEQILDLAGAAGHEDWTCAKKMIEPIFESYKNVHDVANAIIMRHMNLREGYDIILTRKLELLHRAGYKRQLDIKQFQDRALMRLFCLGNTSDADSADLFYTAFMERIPPDVRERLTHSLNVDGSTKEPAVQPTYIPAMLTNALANTAADSRDAKISTVAAMLRYLARCMEITPQRLHNLPRGITVVERDVRILIPILNSQEFKTNPEKVLEAAIPDDQVANVLADHSET
jgi:hypothetical protein